jgi:DNA-binding transcriptional MerR regulator
MRTAVERRLTIQEASDELDVSVHTLRYYERARLIPSVARAPSGHRRYRPDDLAWVSFVRKLRRAGMSIGAIRAYVQLQQQGAETLARRVELLTQHRDAIRDHLQGLRETLEYVEAKLAYYNDVLAGRVDEICP